MTLLTPDDVREFEPAPELSDEALQLLLDAADAEIVRFAGAPDSAVEWLVGGRRDIVLSRPATAISSVVEHIGGPSEPITLASDDYESDPSGYLLYRLGTGTHPRWRWWGRVAVTYALADDAAIRKGVELDLVQLMISYSPGKASETVGAWTTQLSSNSVWNNNKEREAILSRLVVHGRMLVVGG